MGRAGSLCSHSANHPRRDIDVNNSIELFIVTNSREQQTWTISNLRPCSTIKHLRKQIAEKLSVNAGSVSLNLNNRKPLNRLNLSLSDYGITTHSTVFVNIQIKHDMSTELEIQVGQIKSFTLKNVPRDTTTLDMVRKRIKQRHGTPLNQQILIESHSSRELRRSEMQCTLAELQIGSRLRMLVRNELIALILLSPPNITYCDDEKFCADLNNQLGAVNVYEINQNDAAFDGILANMRSQQTKLLFHGSSSKSIANIINAGFQRKYNHRSLYGRGTYFARDAKLAASYTKADANGYRAMLACRVIIGETTVGSKNMAYSEQPQYDTLVNRRLNPSIYVSRKDGYAIPQYLILY